MALGAKLESRFMTISTQTHQNIQDLLASNKQWAAETAAARPDFFTSLMAQQAPQYMWIGCSDSRVPANQITGLAPGEVFVHRNVANMVVHSDLNMLSAVQYAVDILKIKHLLIVGHYGCGGVGAALSNVRVGLADNWVRHIKDVRNTHWDFLASISDEKRHATLCELNVVEQTFNAARSSVVQDAWERGDELSVHGWIYGLKDGLLHDLHIDISQRSATKACYDQAIALIKQRALA